MKYVCMALIRFYQHCLSSLKRYPTCRFTPTCSAYAYEAFAKRGFFAGLVLSVWRILRCSPLSPCGYDPVPEKGFRTMPMRWSKYERPRPDPDDVTDDVTDDVPDSVPNSASDEADEAHGGRETDSQSENGKKPESDAVAPDQKNSAKPGDTPCGEEPGVSMEEQRSDTEEPRP